MGCYLAIYVPTAEDYEFECSYHTFNNIRIEMAVAAMKREGYTAFENVDEIVYGLENYDALIEGALEHGYNGIHTLLKHSDCDGDYSAEEAKLIVEDYERVKEYLADSPLLDWIKSMIRAFDYASKANGIILVC